MRKMAIVYHYCSMKTLKKIMKGMVRGKKKADDAYGWIRLGNVRECNDLYELRLNEAQYEGMGKMAKAYNGTDFWEVMEDKLKEAEKNIECFAFCLSSAKNSLELWERYGDECKGIAIGFDREKLQLYIDNVKERVLAKLMKNGIEVEYINFFVDKLNYTPIRKTGMYSKLAEEVLLKDEEMVRRMILRKHEGFKSEKESRIVLAYNKGEAETNKDAIEALFANDEELRCDKEGKCWFLKFPLCLVNDIYIGPWFENKDALEDLIKEKGMSEYIVKTSGIPYVKSRKK